MFAIPILALALASMQDEAPAPLVTKLHDLSGLLALRNAPTRPVDLCPRRLSEKGGAEDEGLTERNYLFDVPALRDVVFSCVIDDASREFSIDPQGNALRVRGDASVQAAVDRLIEELTDALRCESEVELRVVSGAATPPDAPLLIDVAEADAREAGGRVTRSDVTQVADGGSGFICDQDDELYIKDFEVEIAHGAEIFAPIIATASTGLIASVHASRRAGATVVDVAVCCSEPTGPMRELVVSPKIWLSSPLSIRADQAKQQGPSTTGGTIVTGPIPLHFKLPATRLLGIAGSFVVPDGRALWLPCSVATQSGPVAFTLDLRVRGHARPAVRRLTRAPGSTIDRVVVDATAAGATMFEMPDFDARSLIASVHHDDETWWPSHTRLTGRGGAEQSDELLKSIVAAQGEAPMTLTALSSDAWLMQAHVPLTDATFAALEAAFGSPAPLETMELHGQVRDGATTFADFRLPLVADRAVTIWSGVTGSHLVDWDVDVAGDTAIGNPTIGCYLDGLALTFLARPIGEKRLQLATRGVLNFLEGPPTEKPLGNPWTPSIEEVKARHLFVRETRNASPADGKFTFRFDGSPLVLEVTVARK